MKRGFTVLEILVVIGVIVAILAVVLPLYASSRRNSMREAEVKSNLHYIQMAVETYSTDNEGCNYPPYLIGGSSIESEHFAESHPYEINNRPVWYNLTVKEISAGRERISDPLIRSGYMHKYPRNPFAVKGTLFLNDQATYGDPLRPGADGDKMGSRFGSDGTAMGNVSADLRYPTFSVEIGRQTKQEMPSHADFDRYHFFDLWTGKKPAYFMPGEFVYKSCGVPCRDDLLKYMDIYTLDNVLKKGSVDFDKPFSAEETKIYALCAYGQPRAKGLDVLGPEPNYSEFIKPRQYRFEKPTPGEVHWIPPLTEQLRFPSWTRWVNGEVNSAMNPGSPFAENKYGPAYWLATGNANGLYDGIILTLDGGQLGPL